MCKIPKVSKKEKIMIDAEYMKFGKMLEFYCKDNNITNNELQEIMFNRFGLEISISALKTYRQSKKMPRYQHLWKFASLLDVTILDFFPDQEKAIQKIAKNEISLKPDKYKEYYLDSMSVMNELYAKLEKLSEEQKTAVLAIINSY